MLGSKNMLIAKASLSPDALNPYFSFLYEAVTKGLNTTSYKFALWRALARLAPETDEEMPVISKRELAPLFVEYYWPLEVQYHLRQGTNPTRDPIVMVSIRKLLQAGKIEAGERLRKFKKRAPEAYDDLANLVARKAFEYVIPCFHVLHGSVAPVRLYSYSGRVGKAGDHIKLTGAGRRFLIEHRKLIDYVAVSGWVRFTEAYTSAPRLHDKIDSGNWRRGAVSRWLQPLTELQDGQCFYGAHDLASAEVDHVLPWSFVLEDKTWNLVAACGKCNLGKLDRLPSVYHIEHLCERNRQILNGETTTSLNFLRNFDEWRLRDLSTHILSMYEHAKVDNFPVWQMEVGAVAA